MAQTSAERQRAFRARRLDDSTRLDVMLGAHAAAALDRLARHRGHSKRQVLEALLAEADSATIEGLQGADALGHYLRAR